MKKYLFALLFIGAIATQGANIIANRADAQAVPPQLLVTWQTNTYVPDGFSGKVLPASESPIIVGVDLIDLGRRVDLSTYQVFWYIDEKFHQGATGLTRISFNAARFIGNTSINVRVTVTNYKSGLGKTITIPVVVPEAVIQSSSPRLSMSATPFSLHAYPYFFNVSNPSQLNFTWSLNNSQIGNQNPLLVTQEMAGGGAGRVELSVRNPTRPIETITRQINIPE